MDRKQQLIGIIKKAQLPENLENLLLAEVEKQKEISDEFIADVADTLDRIGGYMQASAGFADAYLDGIVDEAQKVQGAFQMLDYIEKELTRSPRESLQMFTGSSKAQ